VYPGSLQQAIKNPSIEIKNSPTDGIEIIKSILGKIIVQMTPALNAESKINSTSLT